VPDTLPVSKQPVGAAYHRNSDPRTGTGSLEHPVRKSMVKVSLKSAPSSRAFDAE